MVDSKKASRTALMAAIHRFLAFKERDFKGPDDMAKIFLPAKVKFFLSFKFIRESVKKKMRKLVPGTYEYVTARTKFFDEQFRKALEMDYAQIVILGAGYDSRAFRYNSDVKGTVVFELDETSIQAEKMRLLDKADIKIPDNLKFASINFNKDSLEGVLTGVGYNPNERTLFLWEGVSMYLEEGAVAAVMQFVSEKSGKGSKIVFDYFDRAILNGGNNAYGAKEISAEVKKSGEPFQFGVDPKKIDSFLQRNGLKLADHFSPKDLEDNYLMNEQNDIFGQVYGFAYQAVAEVV